MHSGFLHASRLTAQPPDSSPLTRFREFIRWLSRYRSIKLTAEGALFVLLTLAVGIAAINTGKNLLYLLLAMMLSLIVMSGILSEQCLRHLVLRRWLPEHIFANRPVIGTLSIANQKRRFPTFSLCVLDVISGVPVERGIYLLHLVARGSTLESYPLLFARRGRHRVDGVKLVTRFPFGLFLKAATVPLVSDIVVYPELRPVPPLLLEELAALGFDEQMPRRGPGVALYNLRDYRSGDDSRAIHWKVSARQARLIVRETEAEDTRRVMLVLPTAPPVPGGPTDVPAEEALEHAVGITASLAAYFHERGFALAAHIGPSAVPYGAGTSHLYRILHALAVCQASPAGEMASGLLQTLQVEADAGELTVMVLPWADERFIQRRETTRIVKAWELAH